MKECFSRRFCFAKPAQLPKKGCLRFQKAMVNSVKKIGIVTHYYKSLNYGGNLQAYALAAFLQKNGYVAEQISFEHTTAVQRPRSLWQRITSKGLKGCIKALSSRWHRVRDRNAIREAEEQYQVSERREEAFRHFNREIIPHSKEVYSENTVSGCIERYDVFITGSDQVWNPDHYVKAFFLDFVPSYKVKLSYAASIAKGSLTEEETHIFRNSLADYKAVSVREKQALTLIESLCPVKPHYVLDPTLLLTREEWETVCSDRLIQEEYLFCYFLGSNKGARKAAAAFAEKKGLKTVTVAFASGVYCAADRDFGDVTLYDVSPEDFISLIKHAAYVFTDSFHAVVFSYLYEKEYMVFNRSRSGEMSTRITDITELLQTKEHFCSTKDKETFEYIESLPKIDYSADNEAFDNLRRNSVRFLIESIDS